MDKATLIKKLKGMVKKAGSTAQDVASSAIAASGVVGPSTLLSKWRQNQSDQNYKTLRTARGWGNSPDFNDDGSVTDAFKARSNASILKDKLTGKY